MNAVNWNPPMEDLSERLDECELDEAPCVQCVTLKRQLDATRALLEAERSAARCGYCAKQLPVRAFQCTNLSLGRSYCTVRCWLEESKRRAIEEVF